MSLLPEQILPQTVPLGMIDQNGHVIIDKNWWLLLYNICQNSLGNANSAIPSDNVQFTANTDTDVAGADTAVLSTSIDALKESTLDVPGADTATLSSSVNALKESMLDVPFIPSYDNPKTKIGLVTYNGIAATYMRADAAPALSQAITPTWTGAHTFTPSSGTGVTINGNNGTYAFDVNAGQGQWAAILSGNSEGANSKGLYVNAGTTSADYCALFQSYAGATYLQITGAGLVSLPSLTASTGTTLIESGDVIYSLTSSRDYKVDIEDANEAALANVLKLRPVWYRSNPKTTSDRPDFSWYGLIAEEVHEIDPRLVNYWDQGKGKKGMKPKSVGYERIAPLLIPHINRLYARIEALEAMIKEMRKDNHDNR